MVQILPKFDPWAKVGAGIGGGISDALKILGKQQRTIAGFDALKGLNLENMDVPDMMRAVGIAFADQPHMQRQAAEMIGFMRQQKAADALRKSRKSSAEQTRRDYTPTDSVEEVIAWDDRGDRVGAIAQDTSPQPMAEKQVAQRSQQAQMKGDAGERDLRQIPRAREQDLSREILTPDEIEAAVAPFYAIGDVTGGQQAIKDAREQKLKARELQIEEAKQRDIERERQRTLENELAQDVLGRTNSLLSSKGLIKEGGTQPEQWNRIAYNEFQNLREKNPGATDETLWQQAGRKLERKINDIAGAGDTHFRPTFRMDKKRRADAAKKWTQSHLKAYGNTPEDREIIKTIMMNNGWSREEATGMVSPFSKELESSFAKLPKLPQAVGPMAPPEMRPRMQAKRAEAFAKNKDRYVNELMKAVQPSDSILLLKNRLVRQKGLEDEEAFELIQEMKNRGLDLMEHQVAEEAFLGENTVPSLYDLFGPRSVVELFGPLVE